MCFVFFFKERNVRSGGYNAKKIDEKDKVKPLLGQIAKETIFTGKIVSEYISCDRRTDTQSLN